MNKDELLKIASALLKKTEDGKAKWLRFNIQLEGPDSIEGLALLLPKSRIELIFREYSTAPDDYAFIIKNKDDEILESVFVEPDDKGFDLLENLYNEAKRKFLKWDETLEDINKAIRSDGTIGQENDPDEMPF